MCVVDEADGTVLMNETVGHIITLFRRRTRCIEPGPYELHYW